VATSKEIWAYLLCSECEQRFHKYGENYVLKNCYRGPADFPLQTALVQSGPPIVLPKARVYRTQNVSGIEIDKLVYFASSMFWRASAHLWKDGEGVLDTPSLDDICDRAGFTRGAFYVHFADREALLVAVMDHVGESFVPGSVHSEAEPPEHERQDGDDGQGAEPLNVRAKLGRDTLPAPHGNTKTCHGCLRRRSVIAIFET